MVSQSCLLLITIHLVHHHISPGYAAIPKYPDVDIPSNGILPNPVQYFHQPSDEEDGSNVTPQQVQPVEDRTQQARFGFNHGSSSYSGGGIEVSCIFYKIYLVIYKSERF
uniref:Uncharacterized protein n=1 Tax=Cacopsylla melanoneura TaxID=428564 RepID=A0A8D8XB13_9HEMI